MKGDGLPTATLKLIGMSLTVDNPLWNVKIYPLIDWENLFN